MRIKHGLQELVDLADSSTHTTTTAETEIASPAGHTAALGSTSLSRNISSSPISTTSSSSNPHSALVLSFGIGVRQLRDAQGWSQEQLAERSNLNRSYIGEIERGCAIASLVTVEKLASALKVSPSTLVTRGEAISQMNLVKGINLMAIAC